MSRLDEIKARLADITPGNWEAVTTPTLAGRVMTDFVPDDYPGILWVSEDMSHDDARFIANAPDDIRWLLSELERADREHR